MGVEGTSPYFFLIDKIKHRRRRLKNTRSMGFSLISNMLTSLATGHHVLVNCEDRGKTKALPEVRLQ